MPRSFRSLSLMLTGILLLGGSLFAQAPTRSPNLRLLQQPAARKAAVLPMLPSGPLPQVPMNEIPATAPQVSYQNGMLSIVAQNSTLGDILREVHKRTGATIDVPPNATERVAARLGPAPARDVLTNLLNGSPFNYVMVGSPSDPGTVSSLVLTMKPASGAATETASNQPQQYVPPQVQQVAPAPGMGPGGPVAQAQSDDEADAEEDAEDKDDQDQDQAQGANATGADDAQPNAGPKTPEQILEMLRQRQQQMPPGQNPLQRMQNPPPPDQ